MAYKVLLVDDDEAVRRPVRRFLERAGFDVCEAGTRRGAESTFHRERPDAVLLDYTLPDGDALEILPRLKTSAPDVPVIVLTGYGTIERAVQSLKEGADDFVTKPIELAELTAKLTRMLGGREPRVAAADIDPFVGSTDAVRELAREVELAVRSESPVLLRGETGTGKGVLAHWIHEHGARSSEPFVALNCGGLSRELLESELFGHARGAFTGAVQDKAGLLDAAAGGTLFLDEIGDMDPEVQPKLLTVLDDRTYRRLGEIRERRANLRLLAATNRDLGGLVREKRFRPDLYFRINTLSIRVPTLHERRDDIPELVALLLRRHFAEPAPGVTPAAMAALTEYEWPGNFRELRSVLERAALASHGEPIDVDHLRFDTLLLGGDRDTGGSLADAEREHIERALSAERGHVTRTAERLGIARSTLYEKLRTLGIEPGEFR